MKACLAGVVLLFACASAQAANLYVPGNWPALATDRNAHKVGDILTILVYESATASNTASSGSKKGSSFGGQISGGASFSEAGKLDLNGQSNDTGTTGRSGGMVTQISAVVDEVLPNGDLRVSGSRILNINGDKTNIRVRGRVRAADITSANAVVSTRLADVAIDYDGTGFVSSSASPGIVSRIFNWLGII